MFNYYSFNYDMLRSRICIIMCLEGERSCAVNRVSYLNSVHRSYNSENYLLT